MKTPPRFAVLIPTYNGANCIGEALQSIIRWCEPGPSLPQVYLFDDCSSDDTLRIAQESQASLPLHIVRNQRNLGECGNVNHAMAALRAWGFDWVMLLHQDDLLAGPWIQTCLHLLEKPDPALGMICCTNLYCELHESREIPFVPQPEKLPYTEYPGTDASIRSLRHNWFWSISGSVFLTSAYVESGGMHPHLRFAGDVDFLVRFMLGGHATLQIAWPAILKRYSDESQTARANATGADIICWAYLMHKYLPFSSKAEQTAEYCKQAKNILRRALLMARRGRATAAPTQIRSLLLIFQSYCALITGSDGLIPAEVRPLLDFTFTPLAANRPAKGVV